MILYTIRRYSRAAGPVSEALVRGFACATRAPVTLKRNTMRTSIWSAIFAILPFVWPCAGASQQQPAQQQEKKVETAAPPQSPRITIPSSPQPADPAAKPADPAKLAAPPPEKGKVAGVIPLDDKAYIIGAEDVIRIEVWGDPRLSGDFLVRPDGKISMNLIGDVMASGKTPEDLSVEVGERLKAGEFMRSPSVIVGIKDVRSKKYYLQGEVNKPGAVPLVVPTTILEALVQAGGFRDFARKNKIRILRMKDGVQKEFKFDYNAVTKGKHLEQNIKLEPGDMIIVP
jgi:polysaccharide export outer membrane protein